jgi:carbon monoxide dehydrogenase subunit G
VKIAGNAVLHAPADEVWAALNDPAVLVRTIPGCQQLEAIGQDCYSMTVAAGVASIKGVYSGQVALHDQQPPGSFRLKASGAGAPGTVSADVRVSLVDGGDGTTRLQYDADAVVGGMVGGVGQRMLTGVAKKTAGEFFSAVDKVLTGDEPAAARADAAVASDGAPTGRLPAAQGQVYAAPGAAPATGPAGSGELLTGAVVGAAAALLGVLVGALVSRRR